MSTDAGTLLYVGDSEETEEAYDHHSKQSYSDYNYEGLQLLRSLASQLNLKS